MLELHRKEQWDLECWPILCAHWNTSNGSRRVFCLWWLGIQIGDWYWMRKKQPWVVQ